MIPKERILEKLDALLASKEFDAAKRLLSYWFSEAERMGDGGGILLLKNEWMGLCRKLGEKQAALQHADEALAQVRKMGLEGQVGAATTYLNAATVYKAFAMAPRALELFEKAKEIYERELAPTDERLAGLYNNMGLALVDQKEFERAQELYEKALAVLEPLENTEPEQAVTYLNMATAAEMREGLEGAKPKILSLARQARSRLESVKERRDGNYAFVCEKCASVFGYYGMEDYAVELTERCGRIYEGT